MIIIITMIVIISVIIIVILAANIFPLLVIGLHKGGAFFPHSPT